MTENREFWLELLELYKSLPVLWKVKSAEYNNRILKNNAYEKMVNKLFEIDANANREKIIRKINTFRTNYKRELKKVKKINTQNSYKPTIWYYNILQFLEDQEDCLIAEGQPTPTINDNEPASNCVFMPEENVCKPPPTKFKRVEIDEDTLLRMAVDYLKDCNNDSNIVAKSWGAQYAEMKSDQKMMARKIISYVLFQGCLEKLTVNSVRQIQNVLDHNERTRTWGDISHSTSPLPSPIPTVVFVTEPSRQQQQQQNQSYPQPSSQEYVTSFIDDCELKREIN